MVVVYILTGCVKREGAQTGESVICDEVFEVIVIIRLVDENIGT